MVEKMSMAKQAAVRAEIYQEIEAEMWTKGFSTEPFSEGLLVNLGDGHWAKVNVSIAGQTFDIDAARMKYAEKVERQKVRAEKAAERAAEKARKASERAAKASEKAVEG